MPLYICNVQRFLITQTSGQVLGFIDLFFFCFAAQRKEKFRIRVYLKEDNLSAQKNVIFFPKSHPRIHFLKFEA